MSKIDVKIAIADPRSAVRALPTTWLVRIGNRTPWDNPAAKAAATIDCGATRYGQQQ